MMKLGKTTPASLFEIKYPVWNGGKRMVGLYHRNVGNHNQIEILAKRKDGTRIYPNPFYMSGKDIKTYPLEPRKKYPHMFLYMIPIDDLDLLERED